MPDKEKAFENSNELQEEKHVHRAQPALVERLIKSLPAYKANPYRYNNNEVRKLSESLIGNSEKQVERMVSNLETL